MLGSLDVKVNGSAGPPQHTMPQEVGMPGGNMKSGVTDGLVAPARVEVPMIQCLPAP